MEWLQSRSVNEVQWGFIVVILILVALVFILGHKRRENDAQSVFNTMGWFEDYGLGAVYQLMVLIGAIGLGWLGWRLPAELEHYVLSNPSPLSAFPETSTWVGRFAQIIGVIGLVAIALRSMRYVVPVLALMLLLLFAYLSYEYISAVI